MNTLKEYLSIIEKHGNLPYRPMFPIMTVRLLNSNEEAFRMIDLIENKKSLTIILSLELSNVEDLDINQNERIINDLKFILKQNPDIKVKFRYSQIEHYDKFDFNENKKQIILKEYAKKNTV